MKYSQIRFKQNLKRDIAWKAIVRYLEKYVFWDETVLDLGAGYCGFINNIEAKEKYALELDKKMLLNANKNVKKINADILNFCGEGYENHFDVIFASNFFEHFNDEELKVVMRSIKYMLKEDGKLILIQPNYKYAYKDYFNDYTHKKIFDHISIADFLEVNGFNVHKVEKKFLPLDSKTKMPVREWIVNLYLNWTWRPMAKQMLVVAYKNAS